MMSLTNVKILQCFGDNSDDGCSFPAKAKSHIQGDDIECTGHPLDPLLTHAVLQLETFAKHQEHSCTLFDLKLSAIV